MNNHLKFPDRIVPDRMVPDRIVPDRIVQNRIVSILISTILFFVFQAKGQSFQIVWGMNNTLTGVSNHANFNVSDAALLGGANTFALNSRYGTTGAIGSAYIAKPWPASFTSARCMDFTFSTNQYEYNISSFSFRIKRSATGAKQIRVRSGRDGFTSDLYSFTLTNQDVFYSLSVPLSFTNLANTTYSFRIYGYNPSNTTLGVLWFDEIKVNGLVTNFVLPVDLTYFKADHSEENVLLNWETAWEKNSKMFEIERSSNLVEFDKIGTLEAGENTTGRSQYSFIDEEPLPGNNYYRLKIVDTDANYNYSAIRDITIHSNSVSIVVSPNPASRDLIRIRKADIDASMLLLTNTMGQPIPFNIHDSEVDYINLIPLTNLSPGIYVLSLLQNGSKVHFKVLVP